MLVSIMKAVYLYCVACEYLVLVLLCAVNLPTANPSVSPAAPPLVSLLLPVWNRIVTLMCLVCLVLCP